MAIRNDQPVRLISDSNGDLHPLLSTSVISTTYANLVTLRDGSNLVPGVTYRITDYAFVSGTDWCESGEHPFDVLVMATSANTLSEDAGACLHDGDTYFADSNLGAWRLKYTIDAFGNGLVDCTADTYKGFIIEMEDEFGNKCDYDFKNAKFARLKVTASTKTAAAPFVGEYVYGNGTANVLTGDADDYKYYYTFSLETDAISDLSLSYQVYGNTVNALISSAGCNNSAVFVCTNASGMIGNNTYKGNYLRTSDCTVKSAYIMGNELMGADIVIKGTQVIGCRVNSDRVYVYATGGYIRYATLEGCEVTAVKGRYIIQPKFTECYDVDFSVSGDIMNIALNNCYTVTLSCGVVKYIQMSSIENCYKLNITLTGSSEATALTYSNIKNLHLVRFTATDISSSTIENMLGNPQSEYIEVTGSGRVRESSIRNWHRGSLTFANLQRTDILNIHNSAITLGTTEETIIRNICGKTYSNTNGMKHIILQSDDTNVVNI